MTLLTQDTALALWHDVIKHAESNCSIHLDEDLESYLISLLIRYTNKPEIVDKVFALAFLEAANMPNSQRQVVLQEVGDQCLLFAGLFPHTAEKKRVKISYFVNLGRTAYNAVSHNANDLYWSLGVKFVSLMDVLQAIPTHTDLLPLTAYELWREVGSQRALKILQSYTKAIPVTKLKW